MNTVHDLEFNSGTAPMTSFFRLFGSFYSMIRLPSSFVNYPSANVKVVLLALRVQPFQLSGPVSVQMLLAYL